MFFLNGFEPVFNIEISTFNLHNIPFYVVLGVLCGFMSYYFMRYIWFFQIFNIFTR